MSFEVVDDSTSRIYNLSIKTIWTYVLDVKKMIAFTAVMIFGS